MEMGTGMGMVDRKCEGSGNSSLEEIPVSRVNYILALYFSTGYHRRRKGYRWFASLPHNVCGWPVYGIRLNAGASPCITLYIVRPTLRRISQPVETFTD